jgi:hypothetical protein
VIKGILSLFHKIFVRHAAAKIISLGMATVIWLYLYNISYTDTPTQLPARIRTADGWSVVSDNSAEIGVTLSYPRRFESRVREALAASQISVDCNVQPMDNALDEQTIHVRMPSGDAKLSAPRDLPSEVFRMTAFEPSDLPIKIIKETSQYVEVIPKIALPPGYKLQYSYRVPTTVMIRGRKTVVNKLAATGVETEEIRIPPPPMNANEWDTQVPARIPPEVTIEGVKYPIKCNEQVQCRIYVTRNPAEKKISKIPILLLEPQDYPYSVTLRENSMDVLVSGPQSLVDAVKSENIMLCVDVRDPHTLALLMPQETPYTQPILAQVVQFPGAGELTVKPETPTCAVKISETKAK